MFSGIVERMGEIVELDLKEKWGRISIKATGWEEPVELGESIAVQGICLTVAERDGIAQLNHLLEIPEIATPQATASGDDDDAHRNPTP